MKISIFSGGRGNKNLFKAFAKEQSEHELSVIVNGLDDGASTGDIRRLMDYKVHGISDFLKTITAFSSSRLVDVMELRFPCNDSLLDKVKMISIVYHFLEHNIVPEFLLNADIKPTNSELSFVKKHLLNFLDYMYKSREEIIDLSDYKVGNIIFASFLIENNMNFDASIKKFSKLCGIQTNVKILEAAKVPLSLVGILKNGTLLPNEASVVLSRTNDLIYKTYQITNPLSLNQIRKISSVEKREKIHYLSALETRIDANNEVLDSLECSDIIIYGSGTPYSSILPSLEYAGVADKIASKTCPKLLIANLQKETDNYIGTSSLIDDILVFLNKSSDYDHEPSRFVTHVLVSSNNEGVNQIFADSDKIKDKFPWITIIEGDFNHSSIKGTHNGSKVLSAILSLKK